jgi:hypothetical protein
MGYIVGLIILVLLFTVMHFFTEINAKQKIITIVIFASFILGAYLFNQNTETRRVHLQEVLIEFTNGKEILCEDMKVNNSLFSYSSGTQTFIGLKDKKMNGRLISLDKCK